MLSQSETLKQAFDKRQTVEKLAKQIEATLVVASYLVAANRCIDCVASVCYE